MKTTPVTKADLERSVIAVPPPACDADFTLNREANGRLMQNVESGGVRSLMYGGNADFYHIPLSGYAAAGNIRAVYMPLEDCRDATGPIRVLHEAVTLAGIADMGPMLPLLSNLDPVHHAAVKLAAVNLLAQNDLFRDRHVA